MEGWLSDAAGPFRAPSRAERDLFGAAPDAGVGVHGRRTAPIDPLGEGAREALDDDMRVRFTDRLQAEGATAAPRGALASARGRRDPASCRSRRSSIRRRPRTARRPTPCRAWARRRTKPSRPAAAIAVADTGRCARRRLAVPDDVAPVTTLQGSPPPPAAPTSPLERPYGWTSPTRARRAAPRARSSCRSRRGRADIDAGRAARARARGLRQGVRAQVDGDAARQRARAR